MAATDGLSRGSTPTRDPVRSKRYCRPVTGPVTVSPVWPMYSKVMPGWRAMDGGGPATGGASLGGGRLAIVPGDHALLFPQHICFLLILGIHRGQRLFPLRYQSLQQNRPPRQRRPKQQPLFPVFAETIRKWRRDPKAQ